jgi:hypothetical protein
MKENRGAAIIDQLINDIQENDWYCIQNGSECDLHGWETTSCEWCDGEEHCISKARWTRLLMNLLTPHLM